MWRTSDCLELEVARFLWIFKLEVVGDIENAFAIMQTTGSSSGQ